MNNIASVRKFALAMAIALAVVAVCLGIVVLWITPTGDPFAWASKTVTPAIEKTHDLEWLRGLALKLLEWDVRLHESLDRVIYVATGSLLTLLLWAVSGFLRIYRRLLKMESEPDFKAPNGLDPGSPAKPER